MAKAILVGTGGSKIKTTDGRILGPFGGETLRQALINHPGAEIISEEKPKIVTHTDGGFKYPKTA